MIGGPLRARVVSHGRILSVGPELGGAPTEGRAGYGVFTTCCLGGIVMKVHRLLLTSCVFNPSGRLIP